MKFLVPTGIGDSIWALHKIQSVRDALDPGGSIDILLSCSDINDVQTRALDFLRRFQFVNSVDMRVISLHQLPIYHPSGCWNYVDDGMYEVDGERYCVLVPNAALEHGTRLESWLPKYEIDWSIFDQFRMTSAERAFGRNLESKIGKYAVFYLGPYHGNVIGSDGHNRNALWRPSDWVELGRRIHRELGLSIVAVGAVYDYSYYTHLVRPELNGDGSFWHSLIGETNIGQLFSVTAHSRFVISYQSGVGIVSTYLGTPTAIFWRAHGDSICSGSYLSFSEAMASAWVPPGVFLAGTHLPLIYGRNGVDYIMDSVRSRGWA